MQWVLITSGRHEGWPSLGPREKATGYSLSETLSALLSLLAHLSYTWSTLLLHQTRHSYHGVGTRDERVQLGLKEGQGPASGKGGFPVAHTLLVQLLQREAGMCRGHTAGERRYRDLSLNSRTSESCHILRKPMDQRFLIAPWCPEQPEAGRLPQQNTRPAGFLVTTVCGKSPKSPPTKPKKSGPWRPS